MLNQSAVEIICREGGLIVLGPLDAETMRWIKPPQDAVVDVPLAQTVGVHCAVCITKAGSDRARKALGIVG